MNTHYYNTNKEAGAEYVQSTAKALKQEEIILTYFKLHPKAEFTPFEVQEGAGLMGAPITSVRRAMSTLTDAGMLTKTKTQKEGLYKKKNFCWKLGGVKKVISKKVKSKDVATTKNHDQTSLFD